MATHLSARERAHLEPADVRAVRKWFRTWWRVRVNLQHVPPESRPAQEPLHPDEDPREEWMDVTRRRRRTPSRARKPE